MADYVLSRCGALVLLALMAGCGTNSSAPPPAHECGRNPGGCLYEGAYEPNEREYAEKEAARLNRDALRKLRRGAR